MTRLVALELVFLSGVALGAVLGTALGSGRGTKTKAANVVGHGRNIVYLGVLLHFLSSSPYFSRSYSIVNRSTPSTCF